MAKQSKHNAPQTWDFQIFRIPRPAQRCDTAKCKYDLESGPAEWGVFHRYRNRTKEGFRTHIYCPNHAKNFAEHHQLNEYSDGRPLGFCDEVNPSNAPAVHGLKELFDKALAARIKLLEKEEDKPDDKEAGQPEGGTPQGKTDG